MPTSKYKRTSDDNLQQFSPSQVLAAAKKSSHIRPTPARHLIISASSREVSLLIGLGRPMLFVNPAVFTAFLTNSIGAETFMHSFLRLSTYGSLSILPVIYAKSLSIALSHMTCLVFVNRSIRVKLYFIHPATAHNMLIFNKFDNTPCFILIRACSSSCIACISSSGEFAS